MRCVKYALIIKNHNLLKQIVIIVYVMNVLNNWLKIKKLMNAQYAENKIGFSKRNELQLMYTSCLYIILNIK